jgi:hypothetical protein
MMRIDSFKRSAIFAAVAAAAWFPWMLIAAPFTGTWNARALYLAAVAVAYIGSLAAGRARVVALGAAAAAIPVIVLANTTLELALAFAGMVAVARGVILHRGRRARAIVIEGALLLVGLWFARFLAASWLPATPLAVWGFLLVQSFYFLIGGTAVSLPQRAGDPFEEAHGRAVDLLERA